MKLKTIVRYGVIVVSVMLGASDVDVTAQETGRDTIYSRFEEYHAETPHDKIRERLDAFAQQLKSNPSLKAFLFHTVENNLAEYIAAD
jgi:hypothetical protein